MSACRSCGAEIVWVKTTHGGRMPLDADPQGDGTILVAFANPDAPLGIVLTGAVLTWAYDNGARLYRSHFASCPEADEWRRDTRVARHERSADA